MFAVWVFLERLENYSTHSNTWDLGSFSSFGFCLNGDQTTLMHQDGFNIKF